MLAPRPRGHAATILVHVHTISVTDGRERLDRRLFFWSLIAALAGFLFVLALASNVAFFIVARFIGGVRAW